MDQLPDDCIGGIIQAAIRGASGETAKHVQLWLARGICGRFRRVVDEDSPDWYVAAGRRLPLIESNPTGDEFIKAVLTSKGGGVAVLDWACGGCAIYKASPRPSRQMGRLVGPKGTLVLTLHVSSFAGLAASNGHLAWLKRFPASDSCWTEAVVAAGKSEHWQVFDSLWKRMFHPPARQRRNINRTTTLLEQVVDGFVQFAPDPAQFDPDPAQFVPASAAACKRVLVSATRTAVILGVPGSWGWWETIRLCEALLYTLVGPVESATPFSNQVLAAATVANDRGLLPFAAYHVAALGLLPVLMRILASPLGHSLAAAAAFRGAIDGRQQAVATWLVGDLTSRIPKHFFTTALGTVSSDDMLWAYDACTDRSRAPFCSLAASLAASVRVPERLPGPIMAELVRRGLMAHPRTWHQQGYPFFGCLHGPRILEAAGLLGSAQQEPLLARALSKNPGSATVEWLQWLDPVAVDNDEDWCKLLIAAAIHRAWALVLRMHAIRTSRDAIVAWMGTGVVWIGWMGPVGVLLAVTDFYDEHGHVPAAGTHSWIRPSKRLLL